MNLFKLSLIGTTIAGISSSSLYGGQLQFHNKHNVGHHDDPTTIIKTDNNKALFVGGKTKEYFYDRDGGTGSEYDKATLTFALTPQGAKSLVQEYLDKVPSGTTGRFIMDWINQNLKYFDTMTDMSYLNYIEDPSGHMITSKYKMQGDADAYKNFEDNLEQPASILHALVSLYQLKMTISPVAVSFHYSYHGSEPNDFYTSFHTIIPDARILW